MLLENDKIKLRALEPEDIDLLYSWENNPLLWQVGNTRQPYSKYALKQYIQQANLTIYELGHLRLMIEETTGKNTVGTIDLFDFDIHNSRVALGLYIDAAYQGKGFATEALHLIENYVFSFLKINQIYCHISDKNSASKKMFEKEGYEQNGFLKNWIKNIDGYENIIVFQRFIEH
jgi:diamine N-acetyltransferase